MVFLGSVLRVLGGVWLRVAGFVAGTLRGGVARRRRLLVLLAFPGFVKSVRRGVVVRGLVLGVSALACCAGAWMWAASVGEASSSSSAAGVDVGHESAAVQRELENEVALPGPRVDSRGGRGGTVPHLHLRGRWW